MEESQTQEKTQQQQKQQQKIVDVPVKNQQDALQLIAMFLNLAQKRGAFTIDESAKIWECLKYFQ
jgi:hypothetical protein